MADILSQIIALTQQLMGFVTTHDRPDQIRSCCLFVSDWLKDRIIEHRVLEHEGYLSLVVMPPSNHVPVLLMSHLDVVTAPPELFTPRIDGDILWGRGSIDDKYAVALSLVLLKEFLASGSKGQPLGLLITSDEEIGGRQGAGKILPSIATDFGIALDGGDPDHIVTREKGILKIRLTAQGQSAHGSRPWLGKNAITLLAADILALEKLFQPDPGQGHWHRTCNPGIIKGGQAANQVPDRAEAILDVRYTENDDPEQLVAEMAAVVQGSLQVEEHASMLLSARSRYLDLLLKCCPGASLAAEHGSSDARYLTQLGIDAVVWGADGRMSQHSDKEHVLIPSIGRLYERLAAFIAKVAETGP